MIQRLIRHSLFRKLSIKSILIGHKPNTLIFQDLDPLQFTPGSEVLLDDSLRSRRWVYPSNIESFAVGAHRSDTAAVVPVFVKPLTSKYILASICLIQTCWNPMQPSALFPIGAGMKKVL